MKKDLLVEKAFEIAKERYLAVGVDVEKALGEIKKIPI